jgi:hypothetical protein
MARKIPGGSARGESCPPRRRAVLRVLALAGLLFLGRAAAGEEVSREYRIKAAFLYNFAKYVEWPAQRFAAADAPIVIGTFCPEAFGVLLSKIVKDRRIDGHGIEVRTLTAAVESNQVHAVYVCAEYEPTWGPVTEAIRGKSVLTVADSAQSARGMIVFVLDGDKVRFSVDMDQADRAGLRISDQLLKLAISVKRAP